MEPEESSGHGCGNTKCRNSRMRPGVGTTGCDSPPGNQQTEQDRTSDVETGAPRGKRIPIRFPRGAPVSTSLVRSCSVCWFPGGESQPVVPTPGLIREFLHLVFPQPCPDDSSGSISDQYSLLL